MNTALPTYARMLDDGHSYEYGYIEINRANRRKDRCVKVGIASDYAATQDAMFALSYVKERKP